MSEASTVFLPETLAAYEDWYNTHSTGYVINVHKTGAFPMVWHRVGWCGHIKPDGETKFIGAEFFKACSLDPGELAVWAKQRQEALKHCMDCQAHGAKLY